MIDRRLKGYFEEAQNILDNLDIEYGYVSDVVVNSRAKSRWGQCSYNTITDTYKIQISAVLLEEGVSYKAIMDTMLHELLHCHKDRFCHTGEWKKCAELVNDCYDFNIKRATTAAEKNIDIRKITTEYKYVVTCDSCGATAKYKRRAKIVQLISKQPVGSCRCGCCGGDAFSLTRC